MNILEIIKQRHSVRQYKDQEIQETVRISLEKSISQINKESGLNIQVLFDEPKCFNCKMAHYGKFSGVSNYIALIGSKSSSLEETCGYYGEKIVLIAQELGLNTCWVAMTRGKSAAKIQSGEKLVCIIALGYGENQGTPHKVKSIGEVCNWEGNMPEWFMTGIEAALLAPTAINQQKFYFSLKGGTVKAMVKGIGFCTKIDLGIVKYHFEAASGHKVI
ncbi:MAG: nitroreductase family protein [Anaerovoracaceae bacterium]